MSATIWTSERLVYRIAEQADELFLTYMSQDALSFTQSAPFLPRPNGESNGKGTREWMDKCLIGVLVCLPLPSDLSSPSWSDPSVPDEPLLDKDGNEKARPRPRPIGFLTLQGPEDPKQAHHRNADIGITLAKGFQGKGYGAEAIEWVLRWGFRFAGLHRISIGSFGYNPRAIALYRRMGFVDEGRKRDFLWFDGKYWDLIELSMLENEWRDREAKKETVAIAK